MPKAHKPKLRKLLNDFTKQQQQSKKLPKLGGGKETSKDSKKAGNPQKPRNYQSYTAADDILLIGEGIDLRFIGKREEGVIKRRVGNFSFAVSLIENHLQYQGSQVIATTLDSEKVAVVKYGKEVEDNLESIQAYMGTIMYEVDATKLEKVKALKGKMFDFIIFNFPHTGCGITDQDRNVLSNQELLQGFFQSAQSHLKETGQIHVTLKSGMPYELWNIRKLAKGAGLVCERSSLFQPSLFPGYEHRRTIGWEDGKSKGDNEEIKQKQCRIYFFSKKIDI